MTAYTVPKFVRELQVKLKSFEGKRFAKEVEVYDDELQLNVNVTRIPSNYCENLVRACLHDLREGSIKQTLSEPNGRNTFPDLKVEFNNSFSYDFEVKSWLANRREWGAARVSQFQKSLRTENNKYLRTWFVDFSLVEHENSIEIRQTSIGRMWDFADGLARGGRGCTTIKGSRRGTPEKLVWYGSDSDDLLYNKGLDMLENLGVTCNRRLYGRSID